MKLDIIETLLIAAMVFCVLMAVISITIHKPSQYKILQYKILQSTTLPDMEYQVERHMNDGWTLYGELQVQMYMGPNGDVQTQIIREVRK